MTELEQRQAVVEEAKTWIGTPFHFNAAVKGVGVACGPFLIAAHRPYTLDANIQVESIPIFARDWHFHTKEERFRNVIKEYCRQVEKPLHGDVALLKFGIKGVKEHPFSHCALVVEWPIVIHAWYKSCVDYTNILTDPKFKKAEVEFWSPWGFTK